MCSTFAAICIVFLCLFAGCDNTFVPLEENDQYHFSIFGYLDASADTQWVRVMPVREDIYAEPKPIDVIVSLEHVETGESIVMNDSLFSFFQGYVWNFWTTMDLYPEQTYRITAKRSDGKTSHARVQLPPDYPTPLLHRQPRIPGGTPPVDIIYIKGVERLADVQTIYSFGHRNWEEEYMVPFSHLKDTTRQASGDYVIVIDPQEDQRVILTFRGPPCVRRNIIITFDCETPLQGDFNFDDASMINMQIFIASAGPEFHFFPSIDEKVTAMPEGISNVANGTGYLAGIVSKTIPYESCFEEDSAVLIPCELQPPPW